MEENERRTEKHEEEEEEEGLTISREEEKEEEHATFKGNVFLPVLSLTVAGVGVFWYFRKSEEPEKPKGDPRPKILRRSNFEQL